MLTFVAKIEVSPGIQAAVLSIDWLTTCCPVILAGLSNLMCTTLLAVAVIWCKESCFKWNNVMQVTLDQISKLRNVHCKVDVYWYCSATDMRMRISNLRSSSAASTTHSFALAGACQTVGILPNDWYVAHHMAWHHDDHDAWTNCSFTLVLYIMCCHGFGQLAINRGLSLGQIHLERMWMQEEAQSLRIG